MPLPPPLSLTETMPSTVSEDTTATTAAVTTTTLATTLPHEAEVVVYLLVDEPTATGASPSLVPVARPVADGAPENLPRQAVEALLAGPSAAEQASVPAYSTAVPDGSGLLGITVADGVAAVDLSAEFGAGSGTFGEIARTSGMHGFHNNTLVVLALG